MHLEALESSVRVGERKTAEKDLGKIEEFGSLDSRQRQVVSFYRQFQAIALEILEQAVSTVDEENAPLRRSSFCWFIQRNAFDSTALPARWSF